MRVLPLHLTPLPIDPILPQLVDAVATRGAAVLQAEPGAGKTTRVPLALLPASGELWVVEPRRMAALLAAKHVAEELGEKAGETVGYRVRLDERVGPLTRIVYATDGLLLRRLLADPQLRGISTVILDEFHERRLAGDLLAGLLMRLRQTTRPDLRLVVMSATLETEGLSAFLGEAPVLVATGRVFPVDVEFAAQADQRHLDEQVKSAVLRVLEGGLDGDILVFLPGAPEIRRCERALAGIAQHHDLAIRPLHGSLPLDQQEKAISPERQRKIVLSTNIAETSVTLPRVVVVIDSGLARVAKHAAWSGVASLQLARISQASATQRAGRAGRVRAGKCIRLYTRHDHDTRPAFDIPEVRRADLAEALLWLGLLGVPVDAPVFLDPPDPQHWVLARALLTDLGAWSGDALTPMGQEMARFPLHPRLARLVLAGAALGIADEATALAAILSDGGALPEGVTESRGAHGWSDLAVLLEGYRRGSDPSSRQVAQVARQLRALVRQDQPRPAHVDDAVAMAVLVAHPDRVAKRRQPGSADVELAGNRPAKLDARSQATEPEWLVAVDLDERRDGKGAVTTVRLAVGIDPSALLDLPGDAVTTTTRFFWHPQRQRVMAEERMLYRGLALDTTTIAAQPSAEAGALVLQAVQAAGLDSVVDHDAWTRLAERIAFVRTQGVLLPEPVELLATTLSDVCASVTSLAEVRQADLLVHVREHLRPLAEGRALNLLDTLAPPSTLLPGGRKVTIHYTPGQPPWLESRLQDFFGQADGPRVADGRVAVVLHLLAPNMRPVQVTSDLAGFWVRHYPAVKKELGRRYPRHPWPDDPRHAQPPPPKPPRR